MEEKNLPQHEIIEFIKKNLLFVGLISIGIALFLFGMLQYFSSKSNNSDIEFTSGSNIKAEAKGADVKGVTDKLKKVSVDVEGRVQNPGVYQLPEGARIRDALIAAGGLSATADRVYVGKHINQAQKIPDGGKIYVPSVGEINDTSISAENGGGGMSLATLTTDSSGLININTATEAELDKLPKVGPATAKKIIDGRPYEQAIDLVSKKILGQKTFEGLKEKITTD